MKNLRNRPLKIRSSFTLGMKSLSVYQTWTFLESINFIPQKLIAKQDEKQSVKIYHTISFAGYLFTHNRVQLAHVSLKGLREVPI